MDLTSQLLRLSAYFEDKARAAYAVGRRNDGYALRARAEHYTRLLSSALDYGGK